MKLRGNEMFKIVLPIFEGPLDLLLYFIKRDEINIYDIPIARITDEFLNYIRLMQSLEIEIASEFLVMAATLMEIKAKMLLPKEKNTQPETEVDPRKQLVDRLIEYQIFKEVSQFLHKKIKENQYYYFRDLFESEIQEFSSKLKTYRPTNVMELAKAFYNLINKQNDSIHEIKLNELKIEDAIEHITSLMKKEKQISFKKICSGHSLQYKILFFVAVLELVKQKKIYAYQSDLDHDIFLFSTSNIMNN